MTMHHHRVVYRVYCYCDRPHMTLVHQSQHIVHSIVSSLISDSPLYWHVRAQFAAAAAAAAEVIYERMMQE